VSGIVESSHPRARSLLWLSSNSMPATIFRRRWIFRCARRTAVRPDDKGFYLITVKGSRQAGLTGAKGSIIRRNAVSWIKSSLEGPEMV
jgi:hypothetical protein